MNCRRPAACPRDPEHYENLDPGIGAGQRRERGAKEWMLP